MARVTGLTAERMLEIEAASIVDGLIVGDDLILRKFDGSEINAGNVRGPEGPVGPASSVVGAILQVPAGAGQAIASGGAQVTGFNTIFDSGDGMVVGNTLVIPQDGVYDLAGGICWANFDGLIVGSIQVNGSNVGIAKTITNFAGTSGSGGSFSGPHLCEAGDVIRLWAYQATGVNKNLVNNGFPKNRLSAFLRG